MRYIVELTGTSPLLMHNPQLADADNEFTSEIKKLTSKHASKKTQEDRDEIARLEWYGSLYLEDGVIVIPGINVVRCVSEIAKTRRLGTDMNRALLPLQMHAPVAHDGPRDLKALWASPVYRLRTSVRLNGKSRVMRVRPRFPVWSLVLPMELVTNIVSPDDFLEFVHLAGRAEGLGDGRRIGYGRFTVVVKEV